MDKPGPTLQPGPGEEDPASWESLSLELQLMISTSSGLDDAKAMALAGGKQLADAALRPWIREQAGTFTTDTDDSSAAAEQACLNALGGSYPNIRCLHFSLGLDTPERRQAFISAVALPLVREVILTDISLDKNTVSFVAQAAAKMHKDATLDIICR